MAAKNVPVVSLLKQALPADVQLDLLKLAILRRQIIEAGEAHKRLRAVIDAKLAGYSQVQP
jgi:hypothetical protein